MYINLLDLKELKKYLKEVIVKIRLERIDIQEGVLIKAFLDSSATEFYHELRVC